MTHPLEMIISFNINICFLFPASQTFTVSRLCPTLMFDIFIIYLVKGFQEALSTKFLIHRFDPLLWHLVFVASINCKPKVYDSSILYKMILFQCQCLWTWSVACSVDQCIFKIWNAVCNTSYKNNVCKNNTIFTVKRPNYTLSFFFCPLFD